MPYVALDQAPVPTETPAGFDFHAALTDYDTWEKGLPQQQRDILQRRFALSDDVEADRRRFLSVGYVAQATGHPVKDVSEQFENWYMPGFAKSPKGLALTAAPADVNGFFGELTKKVRSDKVSRDLDRQAASSAFQAALAGEDVVSSLAAFQAGNKELMPSHSQTFRTQYEAVNATLAPYRQTVQDVIEAMKAELQTESTGGAITQADTHAESAAVARLVELKKSDPKGYKLVAAALTKAAQSAPKEQKGGEVDPATNVITRWLTGLSGKTATAMGQKLGESAFRGARDIIGGATEAVAVAGANVADTVGDTEAAKTLRAQADVNRDLRDIQNGVLDPIKAAQDGFLGELEAGLYAGAQSAPTMLAAMSPAGRGLLVGSYASDAYAKFRQNGWEGQDAEAMALGVGVFSAAVESASEVLGNLPGIKQGLAKMGMTPGSGWVTQFALRSAGRGGVEFGEEFLQDMAATAAQQWGSAVFDGIPDTPQGQRLSDEYKQWTSRANLTALAVAVLPLGMLGAGVSMRQEMGSIDYLTQDKERVAALLGEEAAAKITAIPDAQKRADEFTAAYQAQAETERIANLERAAAKEAETEEASKAVDELTRRGGYTLTRSDDGWTVTTPDNKTVKTERAGEAVALMARDFSEAELRNASAVADMADAFLMQKRGGESVEVTPGKARDIQDDVAEGRITPESAREAIVTAGRLAGLSEEESMQQIGAVLGSSTIEENEGVREAVGRIYRGANAMTVVEETIEGRWTRGLESKRYTPQQGETWVRLAEQATGESYLPADYSARDLVEAISFIVKADVLGRRKDGARLAPGLVSRGVREAAMQGSKDAGKFAAFLSSFRALFKRVFSTARKLAKARADGKIDQDWENLMDDLLGLDSQARYENSVAKETWKIIEIEGINKSQSEYDHLIQKVAAISDAAQREPTHAIIERHKDVLSNLEKLGVKLDTKTAEGGLMSVQIDENGEISLNIDPRYTAATESVGLSDQAVFHEAVHAAQAVFDGKNTALSKAADATFDPTSPNFDRTLNMFMAKEVAGWAKIQGTRNAKYEAVRAIIEAKRLGKTSRSFRPEMPFTKYLRAFTAWVKNHVFNTTLTKGSEFAEYVRQIDAMVGELQGSVTREASDWVDPDSLAYTPKDGESFSLAPRSLAARVQSAAEKKMGDPEFRAKVFQEMQRRLGELRNSKEFERVTKWGVYQKGSTEGQDAMAERDRKIGGLQKEARFRENTRVLELLQAAGVDPNAAALSKDAKDYERWQRYQESKALLIKSGMDDKRADLLANASAQRWRDNTVEQVRTAISTAKAETAKWYDTQVASIPTDREKMMAMFRTLDAMTSVLPAEVRGKLGGMTMLASLKTDEARARALLEKLDKADAELEKYMQKDFREQLAEMVKTVRKTGKGGEKAMGKIGVAGHRWFDQVTDAVAMTEQAAQDEMAKQEAIMIDPNRTEEEQGAAFETWGILHQFGGFNEKSAAEMSTAVQAARQVAKNGREAWNMILAERKRERQALQSQALEALGGMVNIADIQQGSLKASQKAEAKSLKHWFDQHFTFQQLLDTIFGPDAKVARYFEQKARKATQVKTDAMIARLREYKAAMLDATGATTWKKAQDALYALHEKNENAPVRFFADSTSKTIDVSSDIVERLISGEMDAKAAGLTQAQVDELEIQWSEAVAESQDSARKRTFKVEQNTEGRALGRTSISQLEAVHFTMLARQEQYRKAMERHGITAESLSDIEAWLTPEAKAVRSWLFSQYDKGYGSLNEVYKRMFGIDMPRVREYAPGYFESEGKVTDLDPFGTGIEATGMAAGFLKKRKQHLARPVQVDALQAYWQHVQQVEHWKAWAEVTSEMRAVLANKDVLLTVRAKTGEGNARDVLSWVDAFEKNGVKDAQASVMLSKIMRAQARIALAYKVGVLMKQLPAMLGSLSDISAIQWAQSASRVLAGQGQMPMAEMWKNPVIQRRVESGYSPEMRSAMRGPTAKPDFMGDVLEYGMQAISKTDAAFTTFSASVAYDAHYRAAIESGANPQQAAQIAMEQTEQTIGRTAQPGELMDRSLIEMKATGLGKLMFMFQSAQRQSWALSYAAATGLVKGNVSKADASRVLFTQFVLIPSITQTMAGLVRYLFSDDEPEELWKPADYARAMLLGPSSGIMFFGAMLDVLGSKFSPRSNNPLSNALGDVKRLYDDWQNERDISANDVGSAVAGASLLLSGVVPGSVESVGVTWSILKQILGITERVEKGP